MQKQDCEVGKGGLVGGGVKKRMVPWRHGVTVCWVLEMDGQ